jgi:hypothetical protein
MSTRESLITEASEPEAVDAYMDKLKHPLHDVAAFLRETFIDADKNVGEKIAWNAPAFFYTGKLKPFNPKEYKRYIVVFNFAKKEYIRLVFVKGAGANDTSGLLEGDYKDGRRIATIHTMAEAKKAAKELKKITKELVKAIQKEG